MKLDVTDLRYVTTEEFRVLTAVEMGSKNHEIVPTSLIAQISGLRSGGVMKSIGSLAKRNLVSKIQNAKYDGYRLTYGGYDFLAMRALSKRGTMYSVGNQIGVGKESDIYIVANEDGDEMVLKLHRLGRLSFRTIKEKRDYLGKRKSASWMYMSRLAAQKEWAFMKVLHEHNFPVPRPIDQARHCVLMEFIDSFPLRQISDVPSPGKLYSSLMDLIVRFAQAGLIHGDFNEFNILIRDTTGEPVVIDFPQMVSTSHPNAEWYFNRDVECIRTFFRRRFRYESNIYPRFRKTMNNPDNSSESFKLDVVVEASGFSKKDMKTLEEYIDLVQTEEGSENGDVIDEELSSEEEEEEESDVVKSDSGGMEIPREGESKDQSGHEETGPSRRDGNMPLGSEPDGVDELEDTLKELDLSDPALRELSRSPPRSRSYSPPAQNPTMKDIVSSDRARQRTLQERKYHSKKSSRRVGRPQGSKAKQDTRVKLDSSGFWG